MVKSIVTSAQMRALERAAVASGRVSMRELMERAGVGAAAVLLREWRRGGRAIRGRKPCVLICCGPGNNGGDGFVIARVLSRMGWAVRVAQLAPARPMPGNAEANRQCWRRIGPIQPLEELTPEDFRHVDVVIDALFGIGLARPIEFDPVVWQWARAAGAALVAVDIVSGIAADDGRLLAPVEAAERMSEFDLTLSFHAAKPGHYLGAGGRLSGEVRIVPIGIGEPEEATARRHQLISLPFPRLGKRGGHKFTHGHALILGGGPGRGGAARLAARGALRIGAGLVTLATPPAALIENAARLDAVILRPVKDAVAVGKLLQDMRINALCLGPGLGLGDRERALVEVVLTSGRAAVIDADALTLLARDRDLCGKLHERCVLTPHGGEFGRLFPDLAVALAEGEMAKTDIVARAAARAGCVVLLKGPDTVIATRGGQVAISAATGAYAAPWLATAGAGDVLAGFIAGLLARGLAPFDAAATAAWLHAACARSFGPGLIAEDIAEELPRVLRALDDGGEVRGPDRSFRSDRPGGRFGER